MGYTATKYGDFTKIGGSLAQKLGREFAEIQAETDSLDIVASLVSGSNLSSTHKITRSATIVVAASDAPNAWKSQADVVCTGENDQNSINASLETGDVLCSPGNFDIRSYVLVPDYTRISGTSWKTLFKTPATVSGAITNSDWNNGNAGINISNIRLDGQRTNVNNNGGGLVHLVNCVESEIDKIYAANGRCHGIEAVKSKRIKICDSIAYNNGDDGISLDDGTYAPGGSAAASVSRDILISNCNAYGQVGYTSAGFEINDGVERVVFDHCIATGNNRNFDIHTHADALPPAYIIYDACIAQGATGTGTEAYSGYGFCNWAENGVLAANNVSYNGCISTGNSGGGFSIQNATSISYSDCRAVKNTKYGIYLKTQNSDVIITNCIFEFDYVSGAYDANEAGIHADAFNSLKINNNIFKNIGYRAINLKTLTASEGFEISNNHINNCAMTGIIITGYSADVNNGIISDNVVANCGQAGDYDVNTAGIGIYSYDSGTDVTGVYIKGNKCYNLSGTLQKYGLWVGTRLAGATAEVSIENNDLRNNATNGLYAAGLGTQTVTKLFGNLGYISENTGTATITTGQTSVNVSHGLVAAPSRVLLSPTTATAGKQFYISAKEATTFTITIDSAHSADISFDWQAMI